MTVDPVVLTITVLTKVSPRGFPLTIHFMHEGEAQEDTIRDRHNRPVGVYRELLGLIRPPLRLSFDVPLDWDQYAGCICGCMPGFVLRRIPPTPDCPDCACVQNGHCQCNPPKPAVGGAAITPGSIVVWLPNDIPTKMTDALERAACIKLM